jgi:hypothetical protein
VDSIRTSRASTVVALGNEAWLVNAHISAYSHGNRENHPPIRSAVGFLELDLAIIGCFDLGPGQHHSGLEPIQQEIVVAGLPVVA